MNIGLTENFLQEVSDNLKAAATPKNPYPDPEHKIAVLSHQLDYTQKLVLELRSRIEYLENES